MLRSATIEDNPNEPEATMARLTVLLSLSLMLSALPLPARAQAAPPQESTADLKDIRQDIAVANAKWERAFLHQNPDLAASLFDEEGALLGAGGHITYGHASIRSAMARWMKEIGNCEVTLTTADIWRIGSSVYESGSFRYTWHPAESDTSVSSAGRYLTVWKLQNDGTLRILRNVPLPE